MKKKLLTGVLITTMMMLLTACKSATESDADISPTAAADITDAADDITEIPEQIDLTSVKYSAITEGFDWGPAITKIILDLGVTLDSSTISADTFTASLIKEYTMKDATETTVKNVDCTISSVYVSDETGNQSADGTCLTLELAVVPNGTSTPFYQVGALSEFADISFIVNASDASALKTTAGSKVTMAATDKNGFIGNRILIAEDFDIDGSYTENDITLHYASYIPATASTSEGSNPLIIWLHGAGEGGTDPRVVLVGNKVVNLATDEIQSCFGETGAYILTPQAPTMWMDYDGTGRYTNSVDGSKGASYYTETLMGLIEEFVNGHPEIDKNRIYVGGCSNGGYMTMNMIINYPDYFTAAYPICEAYSAQWLTNDKIQKIASMPIWFTQSKDDPVVKVYDKDTRLDSFSNAAYDRLIKAGAENIHYSLFDAVTDLSGNYFSSDGSGPYKYFGHMSWVHTLNNQCIEEIDGNEVTIFDWLSQQSK